MSDLESQQAEDNANRQSQTANVADRDAVAIQNVETDKE